jgi:hypothetical protein
MTPLARVLQEISAAPTQAEAEKIFADAAWIFVRMHPDEREHAYSKIEDIIREKPSE